MPLYYDTNYILAGMVVERAAGRSLYEEVAARFLKPLRLGRTIPSDSHVLPEVANGYFENRPVIVGGRFRLNPQWEWAGGGFASTAEDLARWVAEAEAASETVTLKREAGAWRVTGYPIR